jgi:hypothetical protein
MYKIQKVSPSALAATEHCPRFRPDGKENEAAVDGTLMHEFAEQMVDQPMDQWEGWIATREASPDMKGLLEEIASTLRTILTDPLPVVHDYRLRMRAGKPRKTLLKPGLYPECELERGGGRHGYIDLLVVTPEGVCFIVDYKSNRVEKDFSLQLAAYACDVNRLCPAHTAFVCQIIAPRLEDDAQLRLELGVDELAKWNERIAHIEEVADQSANDPSIPGRPCDACQYCHWQGKCQYQANAALAVSETMSEDQVTVSPKTAKTTVVQALASLVGPGGPYEGEVVTASTFTNPATPAQRGLRRACMKFLEVFIEAAKEDDRTWAGQFPADQIATLVPGFSISMVKGRSTVDTSRVADIREAVMSRFHMNIEEVFEVSSVDTKMLAEKLVVDGWTKKKADEEIKKCLEPFMNVGAPSVRWTQKPPKAKQIESEF